MIAKSPLAVELLTPLDELSEKSREEIALFVELLQRAGFTDLRACKNCGMGTPRETELCESCDIETKEPR